LRQKHSLVQHYRYFYSIYHPERLDAEVGPLTAMPLAVLFVGLGLT